MWPFASCAYRAGASDDLLEEEIWGCAPRADSQSDPEGYLDGRSSPNFSEKDLAVVPPRYADTTTRNMVKTIDLSRMTAGAVHDELTRYIFCSTDLEKKAVRALAVGESPVKGCLAAADRMDWTVQRLLGESFHELDDVPDPAPETPRISRAQGDSSPVRARSPTKSRRKECSPLRAAQGLQDYASATSRVDDTLQAESRLHAWLITRGLDHYYGAICALGAKKISDLALLTDDDMDELGFTPEERKKINIRIMA